MVSASLERGDLARAEPTSPPAFLVVWVHVDFLRRSRQVAGSVRLGEELAGNAAGRGPRIMGRRSVRQVSSWEQKLVARGETGETDAIVPLEVPTRSVDGFVSSNEMC